MGKKLTKIEKGNRDNFDTHNNSVSYKINDDNLFTNSNSNKNKKNDDIKRSLVMFLLSNSTNAYKRYENTISKFNDKEIENLFHGIEEKYSSIDPEDKIFKKLLDKFDNFNYLLENWYEDNNKRSYIKELWAKNMSLESLRELSESEIKNKLPSMNNWPSEIQDEFINIIRDYAENTRVFLNKDYLNKEAEEFAEKANYQYNAMQNENICDGIKKYLNNGFDNIVNSVLGLLIPTNIFLAKKGINQALRKKIIENAKSTLKDKIYAGAYKCVGVPNFKNVSINWQAFAKSNYVQGAYVMTSFAGLCYSIYSFNKTRKKVEEIINYKKRLNQIRESFESHCSSVNAVAGNDVSVIIQKIEEAKKNIEKDLSDLKELIKDINSDIEYLKKQKRNAGISLSISILALGAGIAGAVASGGVSLLTGAGAACNIGSGAVNAVDLVTAEKGIKELKILLDEAEVEKKKMEQLIEAMKKRIQSHYAELKELQVAF